MIVARIITGIGNGVNTAIVPTWVAETAKSEHRGKLIASQLATAILGIVVSLSLSARPSSYAMAGWTHAD
jgi:MFS family permease